MVEQLTLNQWVLGSSPRWCTILSLIFWESLKTRCGPLVKRSRRRPLTPQTGVRFSHGSPRRNGLHSIQKAQPFGWAFLIPFRHSSLSPQNFAWQTFAGAPLPEADGHPGRTNDISFKSSAICWDFPQIIHDILSGKNHKS